jgi:hypothetical protein
MPISARPLNAHVAASVVPAFKALTFGRSALSGAKRNATFLPGPACTKASELALRVGSGRPWESRNTGVSTDTRAPEMR